MFPSKFAIVSQISEPICSTTPRIKNPWHQLRREDYGSTSHMRGIAVATSIHMKWYLYEVVWKQGIAKLSG